MITKWLGKEKVTAKRSTLALSAEHMLNQHKLN